MLATAFRSYNEINRLCKTDVFLDLCCQFIIAKKYTPDLICKSASS